MVRHMGWIAGCCLLLGCASTPGAARVTAEDRPSLIVEGQPWNAGILNPKPPRYGLGEAGGCVVMGEFQVEIDTLAFEPSMHRLRIRGHVLQVGLLQRTSALLVTRDPGGEVVSRVFAGPEPGFALSVDPEETPVLSVEGLGMRSLRLDLRRLSRIAERRRPTPASP
jgi:hypothetical protein